MFYVPLNNCGNTEIGPQLKVSFERLEKHRIKHIPSGLQGKWLNHQEPVVQSIVSLTISLRHKFVKQISATVTKNNSVFVILMFEILTKR